MASSIVQISNKTVEEDLFRLLKALPESKPVQSTSKADLLQGTLDNLPILLASDELKEKFVLIGIIFTEELPTIIQHLESSDFHVQSMQGLAMLYTVSFNSYHKFLIFRSITKISKKDPSLSALIQPHFLKIEKFVSSWSNVPIAELSEFIQSLLSFNISNRKKASLILRLLTEGGLEGQEADKIIAKLIETTSEFEFDDLIDLPGFRKSSENVKNLVKLLASSSIKDVLLCWDKDFAELEQVGFNKEKVVEAGRIAGIVNFAKRNVEIGFKELADWLGLDEDEVDFWVVRAISGGLVRGKIDTLKKIISFEQRKVLSSKDSALKMLSRLEDVLSS